MIIELNSETCAMVSGGDDLTHTWGTWVGTAIGEVMAHPVAFALGGVVGVIIAHNLED